MSTSVLRKASFLVAGGGVYITAVYMTYSYLQMDKKRTDLDPSISYTQHPSRTEQFQVIANMYDDKIGRDEFLMGINLLRRSLLYFHAQGNVLEVAAGTARNLPYYYDSYYASNNVRRVVLSDANENMLQKAKDKLQKLPIEQQRRFAVLPADASQLPLPDNAFDTVIDTFGLCSYHDPVAVLKELARVCKPTGKILLLEHGKSHSVDFVTRHLDKYANQHAAHWGCVWNRDIDHLIQQSGLKVEILRKWHFGTTYYIVCRPNKELLA